jgi:hypothetical protein
MISSLLYLTSTRSDIQFTVCLCARFQASPRNSHRQVVHRIFRYLKYTLKFGIWYSTYSLLNLVGFSDADFIGYRIDRKNHFWYMSLYWIFSLLLVFSQTNFCCTIYHMGRVYSCCSQILWIVHIMRDYGEAYKSVPLLCDSSNAICLTQNPVFYGRAKHIKVIKHLLRDHVEKGDIEMRYIEIELVG